MGKTSEIFSRDFACWLLARFTSNMARKMVSVGVAWQVYQITKNPLALGLLGLAEALPFLASSLWAGQLVDRHHKKWIMMGADALLFSATASFLGLNFIPRAPLAAVYAAVGLTGVAVSFGSVASSVFVQMLIPKEKYSRAI